MKLKELFNQQDLTSGKIYKKILLFALPIFISSLLGNAFNIINSLVLKFTVGGDAVTSINVTNSISSLLFNFAYGATSGFAVILSNKFGEKDEKGIKESYSHSITLSVITALLITIIGIIALPSLLNLLNVADSFYVNSYNYFLVILIGFIFMVFTNLQGNILRAIGDSTFPLLTSLITTISNILLAFLLSGVIKLSVVGVALATLISNLMSVIITFIYIYKKHHYLRLKLNDFKLKNNVTCRLLKMGLPLGLQWSILFIGSFIQSSVVNQFGVIVVNGVSTSMASKAATVYSNIESYLTMPLSTLSSAMLSFVAQNYGAKNLKRIKRGVKECLILTIIIYLIVLIIGLSIINIAPYIFLPEEEINNLVKFYSSRYLFCVIPSLILQGILSLSRSFLQGIKKPLIPFISGIGELGARAFICLLIPGLINPVNHFSDESYIGLCFSTPLAWLISVIIMGGALIYFLYFSNTFKIKENPKINQN